MKPLHILVTAAAALPMASSAIEMGAAASLDSNAEHVGVNAVPADTGGGQGHKRARRQKKHPIGSTGPAGLYKPKTKEPVRSPYHIVSLAMHICAYVLVRIVSFPNAISRTPTESNLMNLSSAQLTLLLEHTYIDHRRWIDGITIAYI